VEKEAREDQIECTFKPKINERNQKTSSDVPSTNKWEELHK